MIDRNTILGRWRKSSQKRERWNERWARPDFAPSWLTGEIPDLLTSAFDRGIFAPGDRLLEIGCGQGGLADFCARKGMSVVALDFAETAISRAQAAYGDCPGDLEFLTADFCTGFAHHRKFDCALDRGCFHVLPHRSKLVYVENLARCMMPGGRYLLFHKLESPDVSGAGGPDALQHDLARGFAKSFEIMESAAAELGNADCRQPGLGLVMKRRDDQTGS